MSLLDATAHPTSSRVAVPYRFGSAGSAAVEHACRTLTNSLVVGIEPALTVFLEHVENLG
jgi:hypothetical protein